MASQDLMIRTLVQLADSLVEEFDVLELLSLLTDRCVEVFDVDDAGLMLAAPVGADLQVMAASSAVMRDLEIYEIQNREGPCVDCYRSGEAVHNADLAGAVTRWPHFTPAAIAVGFQTVSAVPMRWRGTTIGALNLFQSRSDDLSEADLDAVRAFADVATIALLQHQAALDARTVNEQLNGALHSRVLVEQAKGMLAERAGISIGEAFTRIRDYARRHNVRITEVAKGILDGDVETSHLDPPR